jgi:hypothetical protein
MSACVHVQMHACAHTRAHTFTHTQHTDTHARKHAGLHTCNPSTHTRAHACTLAHVRRNLRMTNLKCRTNSSFTGEGAAAGAMMGMVGADDAAPFSYPARRREWVWSEASTAWQGRTLQSPQFPASEVWFAPGF